MAVEEQRKKPAQAHKYLTAVILIVAFVIIAAFIDSGIIFLILRYLPQYSQYALYAYETFNAIFGILGSYIVYKLLISAVTARERGRSDISNLEIIRLVLRLIFYFIVISIVLYAYKSTLNINLSQVLAGGAIGGIIIGLAVQTVATSILSGFLLSSSRTLVPGDVLIMHSSVWGGDLICKIISVNILFTEICTQNNNIMKLPNTTLASNTTFTRLKSGDIYNYTIPITINADISATEFDKLVRTQLRINLAKVEKQVPRVYLATRFQSAYTFNAILVFTRFDEINDIIDVVNKTFDDVYWEIKNKASKSTANPQDNKRKKG